jgi:acyl-CoA thioester hydrolase
MLTPHPEPPPDKIIEVPIVVRFGDTDPFGVVYFASYFRYFHHGLEEFFRRLGLSPQNVFRNLEEGFGFPIAGASCNFHRPVWYGETLKLAIFIIQAKSKSVTFGCHFYRADETDPVAIGQVTLVAIDREWQSRPLPQNLRDVLEPLLPSAHQS